MTDRELLELIANQIGNLTTQVNTLTKDMDKMKATMATKQELAEVKADVRFTKEIVVKIENDHSQKLNALFDGYKLNLEKLERIENEVTKHEEIILRRIR